MTAFEDPDDVTRRRIRDAAYPPAELVSDTIPPVVHTVHMEPPLSALEAMQLADRELGIDPTSYETAGEALVVGVESAWRPERPPWAADYGSLER